MKGVIIICLKELMTKNFGREKWEAALEHSGLSKDTFFVATEDVEEDKAMKIVESACKVLNITLPQAADAFGEYWVCSYAAKIYKPYYQAATSAKDFLLGMDNVHRITTESIPNARPPRFDYSWQDPKTLIMKYHSKRGLIDFLVGLAKGVGKYYRENLQVSKLSNESVKIVFP